jgi:hypothetical protein
MSMGAGSRLCPRQTEVREFAQQVSETCGIGPALLQTKSSSATVGRVSCDRHHPI